MPLNASTIARRFGGRFKELYVGTAIVLQGTLILLVVLEVGMTAWRAARRDRGPRASVVANWPVLSKAYPGISQDDLVQLLHETDRARAFAYAPWVQFAVPPITGRFVNSDMSRRSNGASEDWATAMPDGRHFDVYFFGGSTMYGFGVQDAETLPAYFEALAPPEWRVRSFNYGQPYYYSRQETLLFELALRRGDRPSATVFMDGLNESLEMTAPYLRVPFFTPLLERRMAAPLDFASFALGLDTMAALSKVGLAPSPTSVSHSSYALPSDVPIETVAIQTFENYLENVHFTQLLCDAYRVACFFVWQPVPMVGYHRVTDTLSSQDPQLPATLLYDKVRAMKDPPRGFIDLSRFHDRFTGQPFVNSFHYSGPFMAAMARALMSCVRPPGSAGEPSGDGERIPIPECEQ